MVKYKFTQEPLLHSFFFFLSISLISLIICLFQLKTIVNKEFISDNERYQSYAIGNRLRQSSNDLTTMARLYINSGEKKYRTFYEEIFAIRKGWSPRPLKYTEEYWQLRANNQPIAPLSSFGPPKALADVILEHHFPLQEFALLTKALTRSNQLARVEIKAMDISEGKYQDEQGNTHFAAPDVALARTMLMNEQYLREKARIMEPIRDFFNLVSERTQLTHLQLNREMSQIILTALALSFLSTVIMIFSIVKTLKSLSAANEENKRLLLNILPERIAERLKSGEKDIVDEYPQASVLFADITNFTELTEQLGSKETVIILNQLFAELDDLTEIYHIEKIKTIGDNYMAAAGIPIQTTTHAKNMANYALAILEKTRAFNERKQLEIKFRIGMTYGPVVAGIIGKKKFVYDIWGNIVNLASRLEESSLPNKIHISEKMAFMLEDDFYLEPRGLLVIKGIGKMNTYFLTGIKNFLPNKEALGPH